MWAPYVLEAAEAELLAASSAVHVRQGLLSGLNFSEPSVMCRPRTLRHGRKYHSNACRHEAKYRTVTHANTKARKANASASASPCMLCRPTSFGDCYPRERFAERFAEVSLRMIAARWRRSGTEINDKRTRCSSSCAHLQFGMTNMYQGCPPLLAPTSWLSRPCSHPSAFAPSLCLWGLLPMSCVFDIHEPWHGTTASDDPVEALDQPGSLAAVAKEAQVQYQYAAPCPTDALTTKTSLPLRLQVSFCGS